MILCRRSTVQRTNPKNNKFYLQPVLHTLRSPLHSILNTSGGRRYSIILKVYNFINFKSNIGSTMLLVALYDN